MSDGSTSEEVQVQFSSHATLAANSYLSRYSGLTLKTYTISLKLFFSWLNSYNVDPLQATRPQIELYVRHLQSDRKNSPATISHHMTPVIGFYRFALIDDYISKDPASYVKLPKIYRDEYRNDFLTGAELRAVVAAAKRSPRGSDKALIGLLSLLGLRIFEALKVQIEDYQDVVMGYRVLRLIGKGGKPATLPLTIAILRLLDASAEDRTSGPLLLRPKSSVRALDYTPHSYKSACVVIDRITKDAGIDRHITPHMFRRGWVTNGLDSGISIRDMQIAARHSDPRTTSLYDRGAQNLDRSAIHILSANLAGSA